MTTIEFLRQYRVGDYAIFDFALTFLVMVLAAPFLSKLFRRFKIHIPKSSWLLWAVPISILVHLLVGSMTPMTLSFIDLNGHYLLKLVILCLFVLGFRGIKKLK